jgi:hypothetical protein
MHVFDWSKDLWNHVTWFAGLGKYCLKDAAAFDECETFWAAIGIAVGVAGAVTLFFFVKHFLHERAAYRRAWERKQAELAVAAPEEMAKVMWTGDAALGADLSQEDMIRLIKEAKAQRKFETATSPNDKASGDKTLGIDVLHR